MKIKEEAVEFWTEHLFSLQMIADVYGVSRQAVKKFLNRRGVDTSKSGGIEVKCDNCGEEFKKARCQVRNRLKNYCSTGCYAESIKNPDYMGNRHGQRIARAVIKEMFPLVFENVVHHRDGNAKNNDPKNLMVFSNQSDHMRWHRAGQEKSGVVPLWGGRVEPPDLTIAQVGSEKVRLLRKRMADQTFNPQPKQRWSKK